MKCKYSFIFSFVLLPESVPYSPSVVVNVCSQNVTVGTLTLEQKNDNNKLNKDLKNRNQ